MSFSREVKEEMSRIAVSKGCCALAELYGIVLLAGVFTPAEIRITSANRLLPRRIHQLATAADKELSLRFDLIGLNGERQTLLARDRGEIAKLMTLLGYDPKGFSVLHLNPWIMEEDCCRSAFLRGMFLSAGYLADPDTRYYLEFSNTHIVLQRELEAFFSTVQLPMKLPAKAGNPVLYCKEADRIEMFLTMTGAHKAVISFMENRVIKDMRNRINRKVNCEAANIIRATTAATAQVDKIGLLDRAGVLAGLEDKLQQAGRLRLENPEASLTELAVMADPPVSKSGLNHRLQKLMELAKEYEERTGERFEPDQKE